MKKKGFTLIEMVVATAIFLILAVTAMDFFTNNMKMAKEEQQKAYIDSKVKDVMDYIQQSLQMSWQDTIKNSDDDKKETSKENINIASNFIKMEIPNDNNYAENQDVKENTKLRFQQNDNTIDVTKNDLKPQPLLKSYVEKFSVQRSGSLITIDLTVDYPPTIKRKLSRTFNIYYNIRKDELSQEVKKE